MKSFLKVWLSISLIAICVGIGLIILAFASGKPQREYRTVSINETYEGVENIDFEIPYGNVKIIEGDSFQIDAKNYLKDELMSYVLNGTWYIREEMNPYFSLFGLNLSLRRLIQWNYGDTARMIITVPKDFVAESFNLEVGAGKVEVEAVKATRGSFTVDAGKLSIDEISIDESSEYNVGAGDMELKYVRLNDITVDCGVGSIRIHGSITGDNDVECDVGKVELYIDGEESEYSYDISTAIGDIILDGRKYHGNEKRINKGAKNNLNLECDIGNITVDFK